MASIEQINRHKCAGGGGEGAPCGATEHHNAANSGVRAKRRGGGTLAYLFNFLLLVVKVFQQGGPIGLTPYVELGF